MQSQAKMSHELKHLHGIEHANYFTCTLGQAAAFRAEHPTSYRTINDLFDERSKEVPDRPAVGFPEAPKNKDSWTFQVFSECTSGTLRGLQPSTVKSKRPYDTGCRYFGSVYKFYV